MSTFKRFLSLVVALIMVIGMVPMNAFATEENVVDTAAELDAAFKAGGEVKLGGNIEFGYINLFRREYQNGPMILDLNGHTIKNDQLIVQEGIDLTVKDSVGTGGITVSNRITVEKGNLTIAGGNFSGGKDYLINVGYGNGDDLSTLTITGGTFTSTPGRPVVRSFNGKKATISGGTFTSEGSSVLYNAYQPMDWEISGGTFTGQDNQGVPDGSVFFNYYADNVNVTISGGTFTAKDLAGAQDSKVANITVTGGNFTGVTNKQKVENYLAEGYTLDANGTVAAPHEHSFASGGATCDGCEEPNPNYVNPADALVAALAAGGEVKLGANISDWFEDEWDSGRCQVPAGVETVLDLAGYTLNMKGPNCDINVHGELTIKDSSEGKTGKIVGGSANGTIHVVGSGKVTIESGTIDVGSCSAITTDRSKTAEPTLIISGGKIIAGHALRVGRGKVTVSGNAEINGNIALPSDASAEFILQGGTFTTSDDINSTRIDNEVKNGKMTLAEGYELVSNGSYSWKVVPKATEPEVTYVAKIGEQGYETLAEAVEAANEAGTATTITMLADVTLGGKLTISGNVTIEGAFTITRADNYTGTLFEVPSGATVTFKDVTVDGGNDWTFLKDEYEAMVNSGQRVSNGNVNYAVYEEGAPVATAAVVTVYGDVILDGATFQNHVGSSVFTVASGATLTMNNAKIDHNTRKGSSVVADIASGATWTINEGTEITNNHNHGGNGTLSYMKGTTIMNGGKICSNSGVDNNGSVFMLYGGSAKFVMNGGAVCHNWALYGTSNGWNCAFYVYGNGSSFIMNDGVIEENVSTVLPGVANNGSNATIEINGGKIQNHTSAKNYFGTEVYGYCPITVGEGVTITGGVQARNNLTNNGTIEGGVSVSGTSTVSGTGTVTGLMKIGGTATITSGTYLGDFNVTGSLTITGGTYAQDVSKWLAPNYGLAYDEATGYYAVTTDIAEVVNGKVYPSVAEAVKNANAGDTVKVLASHKVGETVVIDKNITLDLNGHTLTGKDVYPVIRVQGGADVTVKKGNINNADYVFVLGASDGSSAGNLTIESGAYTGETTVASVTKGTLTINGGEFSVSENEAYDYAYVLNCVDANYKDGSAKIVVKGGKFYKFNPENNAAEGAGTDFVPDGYAVKVDGDYYIVYDARVYVAEVSGTNFEMFNGTKYEKLFDAFVTANAAGTATITLLENTDEVFDLALESDRNITLDGNGKAFTGKITLMGTHNETIGWNLTVENLNGDSGEFVLDHVGVTLTAAEDNLNVTSGLKGYEVVYENGVYKLARKIINVTVTVDDVTMVEGNARPAFTYKTNVEVPALDIEYSVDGTTINATVAKMEGYEFTVVPGTLTVRKALVKVYEGSSTRIKYFDDLNEALQDAYSRSNTGVSVKILGNLTVTEPIVINDTDKVKNSIEMTSENLSKNITITATGSEFIKMESGTLYLKSLNIDAQNDAFYVTGGTLELRAYPSHYLNITSETGNCVYIRGGQVNVLGATLTANGAYPAIQGNGNYAGNVKIGIWDYNKNTTVSNISAPNSDITIYWPQNGTLTVSAGTITGKTAVYAKSGKINISGGEFIATGAKADFAHNSNGAYATGDAVVIEACKDTAYETPKVTISGGTFTSANAEAVMFYACNTAANAADIMKLTGGYYSSMPDVKWCVEGKAPVLNDNNMWEIGEYIATVDGVHFAEWTKAMAAIKGDSVIVLYADIVNNGSFSKGVANKTVTLDLNGHEFTTTTIGVDGHKTLHIIDSTKGGSVRVTNYTALYANGYLNIDSDVDFNSKIQFGYHTAGSTGCLMVDGKKMIGRGHFEQEDGILGTTGGYVTIKNGFGNTVTIDSGSFSLNESVEIDANRFTIGKDATVTVSKPVTVTGMANLNVEGKLILTAGTYDMDVNKYCPEGYIALANGDGTWTVQDFIPVTITVENKTMVEGNDLPTFTYTTDVAVEGLKVELSVDTDGKTAGEFEITATYNAVDGYQFTVVPGTLTVQEAVAEIDGVNYASIRDAVKNAKTGDTVKVLKDHKIDVSKLTESSVVFIDGRKVTDLTIDFNGKTLTADTSENSSGNVWSFFYGRYGANVTFKGNGNITIVGDDANRPYLFWASASTFTVEDGTYVMDGTNGTNAVSHTFYASSAGHIYIKDGFYGNRNSKKDLMNINDSSQGTITVTGGTYTEYFPNTEQPWEVTVPAGYTIVDNGNGTWTVKPQIEVTITVESKEMVAGNAKPELTYTVEGNVAEGDLTVVLSTAADGKTAGTFDITAEVTAPEKYKVTVVDGKLTVKEAVAVIGEGENAVYYSSIHDACNAVPKGGSATIKVLVDHEVDLNHNYYGCVILANAKDITIDMNGKTLIADWSKYTYGSQETGLFIVANGGKMTITGNGVVKNLSSDRANFAAHIFHNMNGSATKANVLIVENGTFYQYEDTQILYSQGHKASANIVDQETYIKGGTFISECASETMRGDFFNAIDNYKQYTELTGGTYSMHPKEGSQSWELTIPEGYAVVENSDGTYTIKPQVKVTINVADATMVAGNAKPELTYTVEGNVAEGDLTVVLSTTADGKTTGTFDITAEVTAPEKYKVTVVPGTLTVRKALVSANGVYFDDLNKALQYAYTTSTKSVAVKILADITVTEPIVINDTDKVKNSIEMTSDNLSKNRTITATGSEFIKMESGTLYLKSLNINAKNDAFYVTGGTVEMRGYGSTQKLNITSETGNCVYTRGGTVNVLGATLTANGAYPAIQGNGNYAGNVKIGIWKYSTNTTISNISAPNSDITIYWPQNGTLTIEAGTITGKTAVYAKSGTINISGGTFIGTGDKVAFQHYSNGAYATGDAVVIEACKDEAYETPKVTISGGTFTSAHAEAVMFYACDTAANAADIMELTGGYYSSMPDVKWCVEGKAPVLNDNNMWEIGEYIATVDGVHFAEWTKAMAAIKGDSVIVLYAEVKNNGSFSKGAANKTVTLDLNGYNFTTTTIGVDGHKTLHITDSVGGGSVQVTNYTALYTNGYLNIDSNVDFNSKIQFGYHSEATPSTGCLMVDGKKMIGRGHYQKEDGIIGIAGGSNVTLKHGLENITFTSGKFYLTEDAAFSGNESIAINDQATVDINGHNLTAKYIAAFGNLIDSADGVGTVTASGEYYYTNHANSGYMPLKDGNGYRLFAMEIQNRGAKKVNDDKIKFGYTILFTNKEAYLLLADGVNDGVMTSRVSDDAGNISHVEIDMSVVQDHAELVYNQINNNKKITYAISAYVTGLTKHPDVKEVYGFADYASIIQVVIESEAKTYVKQ